MIGLVLGSGLPSIGQTSNGFKYLKNYTPLEYNDSPQNFWIVQDKRGIIYAGNNGGILEFDGDSWRSFDVTNSVVRSLSIDENGNIFVGGLTQFGSLNSDQKGELQYRSISDNNKKKKGYLDIWKTYSTKDGVYFQAKEILFRWNPKKKKLKEWLPNYKFHFSYYVNENFYIVQEKVGLMQMVNDSLELVPDGSKFSDKRIYMMVPFKTNSKKTLIGTRLNGFYIYDGKKIMPFETDVDEYVISHKLYHGIALKSSPGDFALATLSGGVVIIDSNGRQKDLLTSEMGLQSENVKFIFEDNQNNLWAGLHQGISMIEFGSPISIFDKRSGLPGLIYSVTKHSETLFVGGESGVFMLKPTGRFNQLDNLPKNCWYLLSTGDSLLVATSDGLFDLQKNGTIQKVIKERSYFLLRSNKDKNRVWVGTIDGLISVHQENENSLWTFEQKFLDPKIEIRTIVEDNEGNLWLGSRSTGVVHLLFPESDTISNPIIKKYGIENGLPEGEVNVFFAAGHTMFATIEKGIFRFDKQNKIFKSDPTLGKKFADGSSSVFRIVEDKNNDIWFHSKRRNFHSIYKNGSYTLEEKPFLRIPLLQTNSIYIEPDARTIWFATHNGLLRYDKTVNKAYDSKFNSHIRKVIVNGKAIYNGNNLQDYPILNYSDRNIRFIFAASFYEGSSMTQYRYKLEGFDKNWSNWSSETQKDYTNITSGHRVFTVQSKNVYGTVSNEALYKFQILPPWYLTWWAYTIYTITVFTLLFIAFKWRSRSLIREKERLEKIIGERTQEIKDKNLQLENQSEKLKEMDIIKSRFFANISHEFRTPLTLLMGPLEQMVDDCPPTETTKKHKLILMLRNAQRLLRLINQLLELSKLDSGKMKLQAVKTPVTSFIIGIADSFRFMAQQKELELDFQADFGEHAKDDVFIYIDQRKIEDVMSNLLVNALKFTPAGGKITVSLSSYDQMVHISVHDTGPGISEGQIDHIFDRFYQAEHHYETSEKGSGIGLSLCKELIQLHHGTIEAESAKAEGTTFTIHLPTGKDHLSPADLAQPESLSNGTGTYMDEFIDQTQERSQDTDQFEIPINGERHHKDIILVIEDSQDMREYIKVALEPDYTVVEAQDGQEGLEKARNLIPDLIVSDIMMPNMDGYDMCKTLKKDRLTSHIPIILLTAKASEEHIIEGLETGADDYVTKPFSMTILSARIKNLIDIRRQLQQNLGREMALQPVKTTVSTIDREFLDELQGVLKEHMSDPEFNVEQLCKKLYMGNTTLYRKINALCGQTPTEFIRTCRLKRAAELLRSGSGSVTEVAFEVGFSSRAYFTKCFKEKFHTLPSSYASGNQGLF